MIRQRINTVEELEHFPTVRTVAGEGQNIEVKFLHISVRYGLEFLGNCTAPMMTPSFFKMPALRCSHALHLSTH